jgi:hypothetical protein
MMALLNSAPATVSITSFPYMVPTSAGQVVFIGTNYPNASNVKPSVLNDLQWYWSTFGYYGGGALIEDYSVGGAWCVAGSGGHGVPPNVGALIFDFADATWKRINNINGGVYRQTDYQESELSGGTVIGTSPPMPGASHQYGFQSQVRTSRGGGSKGSYIGLSWKAMAVTGNTGTSRAYVFDLATGQWTQRSGNFALQSRAEQRFAVYDPQDNRYYTIREPVSASGQQEYLDGNDWTWKQINHASSSFSGGSTKAATLDATRHIIFTIDSGAFLRVLDLDNIGVGWGTLSHSGNINLVNGECNFAYYPPDGCYYQVRGVGGNNQLVKITPPAFTGEPLSGTWNFSLVTLSATLPIVYSDWVVANAQHHNRCFYVPSIQRLAWIAGNANLVALIKPS